MNQEGKFLDSAEYSYSVKSEISGFNEQNPRNWIDALKVSIGELKKTGMQQQLQVSKLLALQVTCMGQYC